MAACDMEGMGAAELIRLCRKALGLLEAALEAEAADGPDEGMPSPAAAAGDIEEQDRQRRDAVRLELWTRDRDARAAAYDEARSRSIALTRKGRAAEIRDWLSGNGVTRLSGLPLELLGPFLDWLGTLEEAGDA